MSESTRHNPGTVRAVQQTPADDSTEQLAGQVTPEEPRTERRAATPGADAGHRDAERDLSDDRHDADTNRTSVLRVPTFSPFALLLGWLVAWGAIATATSVLERVGVPTGFNLGIASGGPGDDGFWAGLWALVVSGGAFVLGGYAAARIARANGTLHAMLVWFLAMAATAADAIVDAARDGTDGVVRLIIGVPFWNGTELKDGAEAILVLAAFAGASLVGAIVGGSIGQTANRIDRTDDAVVGRL